jgi:hypothetical protein
MTGACLSHKVSHFGGVGGHGADREIELSQGQAKGSHLSTYPCSTGAKW